MATNIFLTSKISFMKRILFIAAILVFPLKTTYAQPPNYANYHLVYYDEFDYNPSTFQTDPAFTTPSYTSGGVEYGNWHVGDCSQWSLGDEYWDPGQVTMPSTGKIRLTANRIPTFYAGPGGCGGGSQGTDGAGLYYRSFKSGWLNLNQPVGPYGIMEVKMTIPSGNPFCSFYMDNKLYQSILPMEGLFGATIWHAMFTSEGWTIGANYGSTLSSLTLDVYHIFTVQWAPDDVKFYLDDALIGDVPFTTGRTNYSQVLPKIDLATYPQAWGSLWTTEGIFMDIDYVKIWTMNCQDNVYNVGEYTTSGNITPGLYDYANIQSASTTVTSTMSNNATVFDAPATTLLPNFLADESVYTSITQSVSAFPAPRTITRCDNGYFLVLPGACTTSEPCKLGPISGPTTICYNPGVTFTFTNTTPGGVWESDNPNVVIDPASGVIDAGAIPITTESGTVTISYILNGCSVTETVNIVNCSLGLRQAAINNTPVAQTSDITISPNPTQNTITISYPCTSSGNLEISINDVTGRLMYDEDINCSSGNNEQQIVDMSSFIPGVYFVSFSLNGQHAVKKVVKL
jgi:hypothetical protein